MDSPRRRRRTGPWLAAALALVALALGAYVLLQRPALITLPVPPGPAAVPEPTPSPTAPPPAVTEPLAPGTQPETPEERALPPLAESDTLVRELASGLSSHPGPSVWLSTDGLIPKFVAAVDNIASRESPRPKLLFLPAAAQFRVVHPGRRLYFPPKCHDRYGRAA